MINIYLKKSINTMPVIKPDRRIWIIGSPTVGVFLTIKKTGLTLMAMPVSKTSELLPVRLVS